MTNTSRADSPLDGKEDTARTQNGQSTTPAAADQKVKDADRPAAKPQGSLSDQVATMESEGQAQPQADEVPSEEEPKGIPPLPEPDVEGVGNESGPAAAKTGLKGEPLTPEQVKHAKAALES